MMRAITALAVLWLAGCATSSPDKTHDPTPESSNDFEVFLKSNRLKPGVIETASGLQYEVVKMGSGPKPTLQDTVWLLYAGHLLGSTYIFDKNKTNGVPEPVPLRLVIEGWQEAIQLMPEGSKYIVYIPPSLAYGEKGMGPVGPKDILVFDIELVRIERATSSR